MKTNRKKVILSVDWDYFFPDPTDYDWGHQESPLFFETLWSLRVDNHNLFTQEAALDVFHPDPKLLDGFWDRILDKNANPFALYRVESHKDLADVLQREKGPFEIWNFDQHHDLYGGSQPNCGNWANPYIKGRRDDYHIVYPPWRKNRPDVKVKGRFSVHFEPVKPLLPDIIYICRSSCWTPPWDDDKWLRFKDALDWRFLRKLYNGVESYSSPFVEKERHPNLQEAQEAAAKMKKQFEEIKAGEKAKS